MRKIGVDDLHPIVLFVLLWSPRSRPKIFIFMVRWSANRELDVRSSRHESLRHCLLARWIFRAFQKIEDKKEQNRIQLLQTLVQSWQHALWSFCFEKLRLRHLKLVMFEKSSESRAFEFVRSRVSSSFFYIFFFFRCRFFLLRVDPIIC